MSLNDRRLTGREVLAKVFPAKTKRGYDPFEVDAYLELVAAQVDMLHGDLVQALTAPPAPAPEAVAATDDDTVEKLATLEAEVEHANARAVELTSSNEQLSELVEALQAENEQMRTQLTSVAPPPPLVDADQLATAEPVAAPEVESVDAAAPAKDESFELVLRMAQRSAEDALAAAHARADEIVAQATATATAMHNEGVRQAQDHAAQAQRDLAAVAAEISAQHEVLRMLKSSGENQRNELRDLANKILHLAASDLPAYEGVAVVDLRTADSQTPTV